ncbi:MAG: peptidoglycan DD-metalloendopeptidase family protein [Rhodobacteraceae bacterium]|nr:peptidoglycan DD-metalloendopeptidase family protein [Paracoccaceae bacterium]
MRRARGPLLALMLAGLALPAPGQTNVAPTDQAQADPATTARAAAEALRAAGLTLQEAKRASDRVAAMTETIRAYEDGLAALREGLRRVTIREQAIAMDLDARREELSRLLGVLLGMQRTPEALLLLHPSGPVGTARAGMLLGEITPALQARAEALRTQLEEVALMRALQQSAADSLAEGLTGVQRARTQLSQAMSERRDLPRRFASDPDRLRELLQSSDTLDGFAGALLGVDGTAPPSSTPPDFAARMGQLPLPVEATVLRGYDQPDAAGIRRPGLVLATRPLALVTTPVPATIRYRGPLLDYGNVMILEPAEGYLLVLAGLSQVYGDEGEVLPAGSPIGLMGGADPKTSAFADAASEGSGAARSETLYMELRQGGSPVDPAPWFARDKD